MPPARHGIQAAIEAQGDGTYQLSGELYAALPSDSPSCINGATPPDGFPEDSCIGVEPIVARAVTEPEVAALSDALSNIPAPSCVVDEGLACDPCTIIELTVDGTTVSDHCCGSFAQGYTAALAKAVQLLDQMGQVDK